MAPPVTAPPVPCGTLAEPEAKPLAIPVAPKSEFSVPALSVYATVVCSTSSLVRREHLRFFDHYCIMLLVDAIVADVRVDPAKLDLAEDNAWEAILRGSHATDKVPWRIHERKKTGGHPPK